MHFVHLPELFIIRKSIAFKEIMVIYYKLKGYILDLWHSVTQRKSKIKYSATGNGILTQLRYYHMLSRFLNQIS